MRKEKEKAPMRITYHERIARSIPQCVHNMCIVRANAVGGTAVGGGFHAS